MAKDKTTTLPAALAGRVKKLQKRIRSWEASALLVTNAQDVHYLSGFSGGDGWLVVRPRSARMHLISDFRYEEQIGQEAGHCVAIMRDATLSSEVGKLKDKLKIETLAVQGRDMTLAQRRSLAKEIGARTILEVDDHLVDQRAVKDAGEIRLIEKAIDIQQKAMGIVRGGLKGGMSERELAAWLEFEMRKLGASEASFPIIAAVDANGSLPHYHPADKKMRRGASILFDWGARVEGYCSDMTRVLALGSMKPKIREIYKIVLDAQMAAIEAIGPGRALADIDKVARDHIEKAGYGDWFGHSLGHGIGLDIHEQPTLASRVEGELLPGQVVTVEPGIYLPGVGGVRIEDDVLVTSRGHKVLSDLPKGLEWAII